jgi:hypothetical protein
MSSDERERMQILCARIAKEQDPDVFTMLVQELNDLLERKLGRSAQEPKSS